MLIISTLLITVTFFVSVFAIVSTVMQSKPRILEVIEQRNITSEHFHQQTTLKAYELYSEQVEAENLEADRAQNIIQKAITLRRPITIRKTQLSSMFNYDSTDSASKRRRYNRVKKAWHSIRAA